MLITSEVLSAGSALPVGDVLLSFPVALLMGEGKEEYVQTDLNGALSTVFPAWRPNCRESTRVHIAIAV